MKKGSATYLCGVCQYPRDALLVGLRDIDTGHGIETQVVCRACQTAEADHSTLWPVVRRWRALPVEGDR